MKKAILVGVASVLASMLLVSFADASSRVGGYHKSNGTYVAPYHRSSPDSSRYNNWSTRGNYNPYTGSKGYTSPYRNR